MQSRKPGATLLAMASIAILAGCGGCGSGGRSPSAQGPPPPGSVGSATVSWSSVNTYTDGSPLTPAGYKLYVRKASSGSIPPINVPDTGNPAYPSYTVDNLSQGLYYFAVTAYDNVGVESSMSAEMPWVIN